MSIVFLVFALILAIPFCVLFITFSLRKTRWFKFFVVLTVLVTATPIIFCTNYARQIYRSYQSNKILETINCDSETFYFVNYYYSPGMAVAKQKKDYTYKTVNARIAVLTNIGKSDYVVNLIGSTNQEYADFQKQGFKELVNCKEFKYNALYQANPDEDKSRCYILNRSKFNDYPDCSKEIKAEFNVI